MDIVTALKKINPILNGEKLHPLADCKSAEGYTRTAGGVQVRHHRRIGRNNPCPCHSTLKFKHCCGAHPDVRRQSPEEETVHQEG